MERNRSILLKNIKTDVKKIIVSALTFYLKKNKFIRIIMKKIIRKINYYIRPFHLVLGILQVDCYLVESKALCLCLEYFGLDHLDHELQNDKTFLLNPFFNIMTETFFVCKKYTLCSKNRRFPSASCPRLATFSRKHRSIF